jgi:hypothetical protein
MKTIEDYLDEMEQANEHLARGIKITELGARELGSPLDSHAQRYDPSATGAGPAFPPGPPRYAPISFGS